MIPKSNASNFGGLTSGNTRTNFEQKCKKTWITHRLNQVKLYSLLSRIFTSIQFGYWSKWPSTDPQNGNVVMMMLANRDSRLNAERLGGFVAFPGGLGSPARRPWMTAACAWHGPTDKCRGRRRYYRTCAYWRALRAAASGSRTRADRLPIGWSAGRPGRRVPGHGSACLDPLADSLSAPMATTAETLGAVCGAANPLESLRLRRRDSDITRLAGGRRP